MNLDIKVFLIEKLLGMSGVENAYLDRVIMYENSDKKADVDTLQLTAFEVKTLAKFHEDYYHKNVPDKTDKPTHNKFYPFLNTARKLERSVELRNSDNVGTKIKKLEEIPIAFKTFFKNYPHKIIFSKNNDDILVPYVVTSIEFVKADRRRDYFTPAYAKIRVAAMSNSNIINDSHTWKSAGYTCLELLRQAGYQLEDEESINNYTSEFARYKEYCVKLGTQVHGLGLSSSGKPLIVDEKKTKLVINDTEKIGVKNIKSNSFYNNFFKDQDIQLLEPFAHLLQTQDEEDEDELSHNCIYPIHTYIDCFRIEKHDSVDVHIRNIEDYVWDHNLADKLIIDQETKDLIEILVDSTKEKTEDIISGKMSGTIVLATGVPGVGKCHGKGEKLLMFDGTIKKVEDILQTELLMGDDSTKRNILSLARGRDIMYKIIPNKGDSFTVNQEHILVLVGTHSGKEIEISVKDYLLQSKQFKQEYKLFYKEVYFSEQEVPIDPYWLGLWLGDGNWSNPALTINSEEIEIIEVHKQQCEKWNLSCKPLDNTVENKSNLWTASAFCKNGDIPEKGRFSGPNLLLQEMKKLGLCGKESHGKFIPKLYLNNSIEVRKQLLSGLIDSDGFKCSEGDYSIIQKRERLSDEIAYLARSLGYRALRSEKTKTIKSIGFTGIYHCVTFHGANDLLCRLEKRKSQPRRQNKNPLRTGFTIELIGEDDYYGFVIDDNNRYLMHDFLVTHNTLTAEVFSEKIEKPLYVVQCSQLGIKVETIETNLNETLSRAAKWGAILLIDEADVYIRNRGTDIVHNAIVGVFLRLIEYYNGVMFMTSNRGDIVDDAIISRCTAWIKYKLPSDELLKKIWKVLSTQFNVKLSANDINELVEKLPNISGRTVRNLLKLVRALNYQNSTSSDNVKHLISASKFQKLDNIDSEA